MLDTKNISQVYVRTEGSNVIIWLSNVSTDNEDNNFIVLFAAHYEDQGGQWQLMGTKDGYQMVVGKKFKLCSFPIDQCDMYCRNGTFHLRYQWR